MKLLRHMGSIAVALWLAVAAAGAAQATPLLLVDMDSGAVLYEQDAGAPWHPASLTKLMTALVTFTAIANGRLDLDTPVIMSAHALEAPPSKIGFPVDTAVRMEDALNLLIVKSANDIAVAIAETVSGSEAAFVTEMNEMAGILGLSATRYINPHGLHDVRQVTSARDLGILVLAIQRYYGQYMPIFGTAEVQVGNANLDSNNDLLTHFRGTTGMKTGYVCSSGLNMVATVEREGRRLMAVVLGASSGRERGERAAQMIVGALRGQIASAGLNITQVANRNGVPVDMRPNICGSGARDYVDAQEAAFPFGMDGQPSFLTDEIAERSHRVVTLGRIRDVPLPRPRPANAPLLRSSGDAIVAANVSTGPSVPLPRPRPN